MGGWAKLTRRRFRWSELRFETLYTTPTFSVASYRQNFLIDVPGTTFVPGATFVDGTTSSREKCYLTNDFANADTVSWVQMLAALQADACALMQAMNRPRSQAFHPEPSPLCLSMPVVWPVQNSWDFVPPDVVRPLARSTICEVAILVRRLGMQWKEFDPSEGILKAEGQGYTLSSTTIRAIGTILQFASNKRIIQDPLGKHFVSSNHNDSSYSYIPNQAVDMMGFGILQGCAKLYLPEYRIGTEADVMTLLRDVVDPSRKAYGVVKAILISNPGWTPGISDIIGSAAPMMRIRHTDIVRVPQPAGFVGERLTACIVVFYNRLRDLISDRDRNGTPMSQQTKSILHQCEELKSRYGAMWEDSNPYDEIINCYPIDYLDDIHDRHDGTTNYFIDLRKRYSPHLSTSQESAGYGFRYSDLIYSHVTHAVGYYPEALQRINASPSKARDNYGLRDAAWIVEGGHIYFDNIPKVIESMRDRGFDNPGVVEEAWLTMMFRAFLWNRSHSMVDGPRVPSTHWGSELPVYIG